MHGTGTTEYIVSVVVDMNTRRDRRAISGLVDGLQLRLLVLGEFCIVFLRSISEQVTCRMDMP